jgi:putative ABC transport system substrate-binding protein
MLRRDALAAVVGLGVLALPAVARAQQPGKVYRIGLLRLGDYPVDKSFWEAMRGLGWTEGRNVVVERRFAMRHEELPALAAELVRHQPDLILTYGGPPLLAVKAATASIPILFSVTDDPAENGFVASLARPGGNLTGFVYMRTGAKMVEMLKRVLPDTIRIAVPFPKGWPLTPRPSQIVRVEAELAVQVVPLIVASTQDIADAPATARSAKFDAMMIPDIAWPFPPNLGDLAANAPKSRMPTIFFTRRFVDAGGLMSYGAIGNQHWPRWAEQADKIFRGMKPADIPVEQATRFEFVVNLKTAKALGLTIPPSVLALADEVIR